MKRNVLSIFVGLIVISLYFVLNIIGREKIQPVTARIDISEKTGNAVPCFEVKEKSTQMTFQTADWMPKFGSQGYVIEKNGIKEELEIVAKTDKCKINFSLRGPFELKHIKDRSKGVKEKWVEYTGLGINGKNIIKKPVAVWHNKPFNYTLTMQKGNVLNVKIKWKKYVKPTACSRRINCVDNMFRYIGVRLADTFF